MYYRDRTFCDYVECKEKDCIRRLTKRDEWQAEQMRLGICLFAEKPECFKE